MIIYIFVKTMQSKIIIKFFEWSIYTKYYIFILKVKGVIFSYSGNYTKDFFFFHKWNKSFTIAKRKKKSENVHFLFKTTENAKWILRLFFFLRNCGGVKPRPTIKAQEHRFIKSTPEEEKSLGHHGNTGA